MQELKGKFLIKGKRLNKLDAMFSNNNIVEEDTVSEEDEAADVKEKDQKAKSKVSHMVCTYLVNDKGRKDLLESQILCWFGFIVFQKSKIKLAKQLSDIVIYCKSVHFHGFEHARDNQAFYEMSSFKESKAFSLADNSGILWIGLKQLICLIIINQLLK